MKVFIASDHAGFALKNILVEYVRMLGHDTEDEGAFSPDANDDYPDFVTPFAQKVVKENARGIVLGKSGEGEAMCANRILGARAVVFYGGSLELVRLAREHNNANILSLGAEFVMPEEAKDAVKQFLETSFSDSPRHARRLAKF